MILNGVAIANKHTFGKRTMFYNCPTIYYIRIVTIYTVQLCHNRSPTPI